MSWSRARRGVGLGLAWGSAGVLSAAAGLAAVATQGCWGSEFSAGASQGAPDASPFDGGTGADAADAHLTFCQTQTSHQFCDDFDTVMAPPSNFSLVSETNGGMVSYDTTAYRSPPNSLLSTLTATPLPGAPPASAFLSKLFTRAGTHLVLQADLKIRGACVVAPSTVAPLGLYFEGYALALYAGSMISLPPSGAEIVEITVGPDGGTTGLVTHPLRNPLPLDGWFTITIDAQLLTRDVNVTVANVADLSGEKLTLEPTAAPQHPTLLVGASLNSAACAVHVDNVLFDITI